MIVKPTCSDVTTTKHGENIVETFSKKYTGSFSTGYHLKVNGKNFIL